MGGMFKRSPGKIRCGVAGVGSLGQHHARIYAALPNIEFVGIFETSDARAAEICAKFNCPRFATILAGRGCNRPVFNKLFENPGTIVAKGACVSRHPIVR